MLEIISTQEYNFAMITFTQRNILSFNNAMNSIVSWQDRGCIVNLYCIKVIKKNAKITLGIHINGKRSC